MEYPRSGVAHQTWSLLGWMWGWWKGRWEVLEEEEECALVCLQRTSSSWSICVSESVMGMRSKQWLLVLGVKLELSNLTWTKLKEAGEQRKYGALEHLW